MSTDAVKPPDTRPEDGGPAFPAQHDDSLHILENHTGMSLRDYFAAHAPPMPQPLRKMAELANKREHGRDVFDMAAYAGFEAAWRMVYARAMLAERGMKP